MKLLIEKLKDMRKRFEQQQKLDATLIQEVTFDSRSRHELPQLLAGLQYIFITPELNEQIFELLETSVSKGKKATGRKGMSLWEILVLGTIRLNLDTDYDSLQDLANNHSKVRGIMGVESKKVFSDDKYYPIQTIKDNVCLLTEELLMEISQVVVKAGHQLKKNENGDPIGLKFKTDSYVIESNIHFPTDINLLWDCIRKCLDTINGLLQQDVALTGWHKRNYWRKLLKKCYRTTGLIHQKKGKNYKPRLKDATSQYLVKCEELKKKIDQSEEELINSSIVSIPVMGLMESLAYYKGMLVKHIDLVNRRIIKGEQIPHEEKVFSIFEPHVEWIQKGKHHKKVELGHNALITTDQFHFIVDHKVMVDQRDAAQPIELSNRLIQRFSTGYLLESISFDKGFYSKLNKDNLKKKFKQLVMPNKGKPSVEQQEENCDPVYIQLRKKHSAVESNINELEHSGLNKVPDKGLDAFKKYVALGVLAYNLKRLGKIVIEQELLSTVVPRGKLTKKAA